MLPCTVLNESCLLVVSPILYFNKVCFNLRCFKCNSRYSKLIKYPVWQCLILYITLAFNSWYLCFVQNSWWRNSWLPATCHVVSAASACMGFDKATTLPRHHATTTSTLTVWQSTCESRSGSSTRNKTSCQPGNVPTPFKWDHEKVHRVYFVSVIN